MKRMLTIAVVLMLLLAATPAMAAKGGKPPGNPQQYEVTMDFVDGQGLATTCGGTSIIMTGNLGGGVLRADGAELSTNLPIAWDRYYAEFAEGVALVGCHGGDATVAVPDGATPPEVFPGALWLDFGGGGTFSLMWRFDYYWEFDLNPRNGKLRQGAVEMLELTSTPMAFDGVGPQTVAGDFTLRRFTNGAWTCLGDGPPDGPCPTTEVTFVLEITPVQ